RPEPDHGANDRELLVRRRLLAPPRPAFHPGGPHERVRQGRRLQYPLGVWGDARDPAAHARIAGALQLRAAYELIRPRPATREAQPSSRSARAIAPSRRAHRPLERLRFTATRPTSAGSRGSIRSLSRSDQWKSPRTPRPLARHSADGLAARPSAAGRPTTYRRIATPLSSHEPSGLKTEPYSATVSPLKKT